MREEREGEKNDHTETHLWEGEWATYYLNPGRLVERSRNNRAGRRRQGVSRSPCNGSERLRLRARQVPLFADSPSPVLENFPPISLPAALDPSTATNDVK